jgi:hypothetical protein
VIFEDFSKREDIKAFISGIITDRYCPEPELDFTPQSIIITATPLPSSSLIYIRQQEKHKSFSHKYRFNEVKNYLAQGNNYHFFL